MVKCNSTFVTTGGQYEVNYDGFAQQLADGERKRTTVKDIFLDLTQTHQDQQDQRRSMSKSLPELTKGRNARNGGIAARGAGKPSAAPQLTEAQVRRRMKKQRSVEMKNRIDELEKKSMDETARADDLEGQVKGIKGRLEHLQTLKSLKRSLREGSRIEKTYTNELIEGIGDIKQRIAKFYVGDPGFAQPGDGSGKPPAHKVPVKSVQDTVAMSLVYDGGLVNNEDEIVKSMGRTRPSYKKGKGKKDKRPITSDSDDSFVPTYFKPFNVRDAVDDGTASNDQAYYKKMREVIQGHASRGHIFPLAIANKYPPSLAQESYQYDASIIEPRDTTYCVKKDDVKEHGDNLVRVKAWLSR